MAGRWTEVTVKNLTRLNLRKVDETLNHGVWDARPPVLIGDQAVFAS